MQRVVSITADCDADALVEEVVKSGPACHTGAESCFFNEVYVSPELKQFSWQDLWDCINDDFDADPLAAVEAYFAEVEKVAALKPDILAHIDLIKKLNANGEFFDEESPRYKAAALKALQAAKANDCLLEVNTGSVYRGYRKDFYPGPWLLGEWQKMGGKVIITSDSHDINSLTFGFDEAAAAIKAAGFTSVQVLTGNGFETQEL